jgi:hypothetical protein
MGTSTSSKGGSAGSPFDPAWLPPSGTETSVGGDGSADGDQDADQVGSSSDVASERDDASTTDGTAETGDAGAFAPDRRFALARTKMSDYLSGGGRDSLRSAAKSMVNKGMGGPRRAASTMRGTSRGAGQLGQFLASARDGSDPKVVDWVQRVRDANLSADDLILELVKEVLPDTGSVDDESLRNAAAEALAKLYENAPEVDVLNLNDDQIAEVIGYTIANDVCNRMDLQLGQTYERLKFDPQQVQLYRNDVKEYVHSEVKVMIERHGALRLDPQRLAKEVLASTLQVFSE